jgi:hypothetical protein
MRRSMRCSHESVRAFILRPGRSRRLIVWFLASHATAVAGILTLPIDIAGRAGALLLVALHAAWRWPRSVSRIVAADRGTWSLPELGHTDLVVANATTVSTSLIELVLDGADGRVVVLLCRDQLSASAWRRLQARVRLDLGRAGLS